MVSLIYAKVIILKDFLNHVEFYIIHSSSVKTLEAFILFFLNHWISFVAVNVFVISKELYSILTVSKFVNVNKEKEFGALVQTFCFLCSGGNTLFHMDNLIKTSHRAWD